MHQLNTEQISDKAFKSVQLLGQVYLFLISALNQFLRCFEILDLQSPRFSPFENFNRFCNGYLIEILIIITCLTGLKLFHELRNWKCSCL